MTPELEDRLFEAFPQLFRGRSKPKEESSMCFGINCDDNWFDLIWRHCLALEEQAVKEGRDRSTNTWPEATQVKEKCCSLRFYLANESFEMEVLRYKLLTDSLAVNDS